MFDFIKKLLPVISESVSPTGDYAALTLSKASAEAITAWASKHGIIVESDYEDAQLHITTVYSKTCVEYDWSVLDSNIKGETATATGFDVFTTPNSGKSCLVLLVDCPYAVERFNEYMKAGASFDYDAYTPHITLTTKWAEAADKSLPPLTDFPNPIVLASEYHDKLDD